jgi:hypothetical protein
MRRNQAYPSKWLKAEDLNGQDLTVHIKAIDSTEFDDGNTQRVLYFADAKIKPLGLNVTNWETISDLHGEDDDDWIGCAVTLYPTKTKNQQGQRVACIRVRDEKPAQSGKAPRTPIERNNEEFDEFTDRVAAKPVDNGTGNGNGKYASEAQTISFMTAMTGYLDKRNGAWNDRWTDKRTGEIPDGVKEPVNRFQADNHLAKWAVEQGLLAPGSVPDGGLKPNQEGRVSAIVFHSPNRKRITSELARYYDVKEQETLGKLQKSHPQLFDPADGPGDGELMDAWDEGRE